MPLPDSFEVGRSEDRAAPSTFEEPNRVSKVLADSGASTKADFSERCHAAGVVKCVGFDTKAEVYAFLRPNGDGLVEGFLDEEIKASGQGSLRFDIPSQSGPNSAGSWDTEMGQTFGPGDTFYVQFRQRFDDVILKEDFGGGGWKQVMFYAHPKPCASVELATQNIYYRGFPQMFTDCGGRGLYTNGGVPPTLLQQGDYNCRYKQENSTDCSLYRPAQWMTFCYKVALGKWGAPESSVEAWVSYEGEPLKKFVDMHNFRLDYNDGPSDRFDRIVLTPYDTNKPSQPKHPVAHTWYDELIISTKPIKAPSGPIPK